MTTSIVSPNATIGMNFKLGAFNIIDAGAEVGDNVAIGNFCHISAGVVIGNNTIVMDYVELRNNTIIGQDCYIDSRVSSSGNVTIADRVTIRYDTILARGVEVGEGTYICPRVMTNNLNAERQSIGGAKIGKHCFIGTNAVLQHGVLIDDYAIIGSMSFVNKDCRKRSTYIGIPATLKER